MTEVTSNTETYLSQYPDLANWFTSASKQSPDDFLFDFCLAINCQTTREICSNLAQFLTSLFKKNSHSIISQIENIEGACSLYHMNFQSFLVSVIEEGFSQNLYKDLSEVIKLIGSQTRHPIFCFISAWISLNENMPNECIVFCDKSSDMSSDFYGIKGQALLECKSYVKALNCFECATELSPQEPLHWYWLAKASFAIGLDVESWIAAEQCQKLAPKNLEANTMLGYISCEGNLSDSLRNRSWETLVGAFEENGSHGEIYILLLKLGAKLNSEQKVLDFIKVAELQLPKLSEESTRSLAAVIDTFQVKRWNNAIKQLTLTLRNAFPNQPSKTLP